MYAVRRNHIKVLLLTTLALAAVEGNSTLELLMLGLTWGAAAVLRFVVLRGWVYRRSRSVTAGE